MPAGSFREAHRNGAESVSCRLVKGVLARTGVFSCEKTEKGYGMYALETITVKFKFESLYINVWSKREGQGNSCCGILRRGFRTERQEVASGKCYHTASRIRLR